MKKIITLLASGMVVASLWAIEPDETVLQYASNYYAYPVERLGAPALTPAPEGYKPFHIEHYGRHGSRWHIGENAYKKPVELMEIAERNGKLTPRGKELLGQLRELRKTSEGRDGELSPLGAIQHRGIGRRMVKNFPEVFADDAYVTGRSSTVVRCILSMDNELQEMAAANPSLRITSDATESEMYRLAGNDTTGMEPGYRRLMSRQGRDASSEFAKKHPVGDSFLDVIFTDRQFALDSIDTSRLGHYLFNIAANAQSLDRSPFPNFAPYDIFTPKELKDRWVNNNVAWFMDYGNSKITGNLKPFYQKA